MTRGPSGTPRRSRSPRVAIHDPTPADAGRTSAPAAVRVVGSPAGCAASLILYTLAAVAAGAALASCRGT